MPTLLSDFEGTVNVRYRIVDRVKMKTIQRAKREGYKLFSLKFLGHADGQHTHSHTHCTNCSTRTTKARANIASLSTAYDQSRFCEKPCRAGIILLFTWDGYLKL